LRNDIKKTLWAFSSRNAEVLQVGQHVKHIVCSPKVHGLAVADIHNAGPNHQAAFAVNISPSSALSDADKAQSIPAGVDVRYSSEDLIACGALPVISNFQYKHATTG
jgi:hypothetical protein